jgi:hypothetical protein
MKKSILGIICIVMFMVIGCSKSEEEIDYSKLPDTFGIELYNVEVGLHCEDDYKKNLDFSFMSRIDIPLDSKIILEYNGGTMNYSYELTNMESSIEKYRAYHIALDCKDISIENDRIDISNIIIQYDKNDEENVISMKPQKCSFVRIFDAHMDEKLYFQSYAVLIPNDMNDIPFDIYTEEELVSLDSYLTNSSFKVTNKSQLEDIVIGKDNSKGLDIRFNLKKNDMATYTEYTTSIVFVYKINEKENAILSSDVIYNMCNDENLSKYFNEVLLKK